MEASPTRGVEILDLPPAKRRTWLNMLSLYLMFPNNEHAVAEIDSFLRRGRLHFKVAAAGSYP